MITDFSTGASREPVASCATAFACLLRLSSHADSAAKDSAVPCRGIVEGDSLPLPRLVELAGQLGLEAEHARSDWHGLQAMGSRHSILALLKNSNLVVLTAAATGGEALAVWDPLDWHDRVHFVPREKFEAVWTGDVVIIRKEFLQRSESSKKADFCWFTPAGSQLLGKKSANRQRPKLMHRETENAGGARTSGARNARQQPDEAAATGGTAMDDSSSPSVPGLTGRGEWLRVSRLYLVAAAILAIGVSGLFLLRHPAADIFAIAINPATKAGAEASNSGSSTDPGSLRGAYRLPQTAVRLRSASAVSLPPSVPNTAATQPSSVEGRLHQAAARVEADMKTTPRSATASLVASASAEPTPELATPAPALAVPDPPAARAPTIPSGSSAETNSGFATAVAATLSPPAAANAPTGSNREETSAIPLAPPAAPAKDPAPTIAAANAAPAPNSAPEAAADSARAKPTAVEPSAEPRFSAAETATLLARGDALLSTGDITSARLFYERAADAGAGLAAVRLGETFDPAFLDRAHLRNARGDPGQAISWYRRARDLGVTDAEVLLKALQNN